MCDTALATLSTNSPNSLPQTPVPTRRHPPSPTAQAMRLRMALAVCLLLGVGAFGLYRALAEPSSGWRFGKTAQGTLGATATRDTGSERAGDVLDDVVALQAGAVRLALQPADLIESPGFFNSYAEQNRFFAHHRALWALLQQPGIVIEHRGSNGSVVTTPAGVSSRQWGELGARFWVPWLAGMLSLSVGLGLWVYRPRQLAAQCYLGACLSYAVGMVCAAGWGSRLLTQAPALWPHLHVLAHIATHGIGLFLVAVLWWHPQTLYAASRPLWVRAWLPLALGALDLWSTLADMFQWLDSITYTFRRPSLGAYIGLLVAFVLQWRASRGQPVMRLQLRWFGFLLLLSLSILFGAVILGSVGIIVPIPQNYGYALVALLFVGTVPLVARLGWFQLEQWWTRLWVWFLGGLLVVALDLALLATAPLWPSHTLDRTAALTLALAAAGWLYFPLRQALWSRLMRHTVATTQDLLPAIVRLARCPRNDLVQLQQLWSELWTLSCRPLSQDTGVPDGAAADTTPGAPKAWVSHSGEALHIVAPAPLASVTLWWPDGGKRLFRPQDLRRAQQVLQLVTQALSSSEAFEQGAQSAREHLLREMHDGLGAQLMTALRGVERGAMPREQVLQALQDSLDDLRLLMDSTDMGRELFGALITWRSRWSPRLSALGVDMHWQLDDALEALALPPDTVLQIMRIVQEATVNVVKHAHASRMSLQAVWTGNDSPGRSDSEGTLQLTIEDDGVGLDAEPRRAGARGLSNMASRAQQIGAALAIAPVSPPGRGTRVTLRMAGKVN